MKKFKSLPDKISACSSQGTMKNETQHE